MGYIEAIAISREKGVVKKETAEAKLVQDWGIEGDAHAGNWPRQVSLLAGESIDRIKEKIPDLAIGAFAENLVTRGIDLRLIKIRERLILADNIILEVTQIGKECHSGCVIKEITGDCIMPREGIFAKVISGGRLQTGDKINLE